MDYKNGMQVLPAELLAMLQEYVDGMYIYIPRKSEHRQKWGVQSPSYAAVLKRNQEIFDRYQAGTAVVELAEEYFLAPKTVYRILSKMKKF